MKKFVIIILIAVAAYWTYNNYGSIGAKFGFRKSSGSQKVLLFTADACGAPCNDVAIELKRRNIAFEEINVMTEEGRSRIGKYGVTSVPLTIIGDRQILGNDLLLLQSALAEVNGKDVFNSDEQQVMKNHFDEKGKPRVVLYGTSRCPYCTRLRAFLDDRHIPFTFVDIEASSSARSDFDTLHGRGYPLTFVGFRRIDGYDENKVMEAVKDLVYKN